MATLPSPTQVSGSHSAIYESYYNIIDPNGLGTVGGMEAARFLKKSGLSDVILSKIWDLSDPGGRGCLDKSGMFVALKLVALVQNGKDLSIANINLDVAPPKIGDLTLNKPLKPLPPTNTLLITSLPPSTADWTVKPPEREKYEALFESLQPSNGLIPGAKVKNVLLESKLPFETLGRIWDLADQDKDGMLDRHEFIAAMHLVYKALEKYAIPNSLPLELMPPSKAKNGTSLATCNLNRHLDSAKPESPSPPFTGNAVPSIKPVQPVQPTIPWVITPDEKAKSDALFVKSDVDKDGFVSGQEIKNVFLQSGVPQHILAHIWALCDIKQSGKLNNEQFALAMWLVARCLKGIDPPSRLTPDMVPPSFRIVKQTDELPENNNTRYSNVELDMISKDIGELISEKSLLENDIAQKEADIKVKSSEIRSLQSELDTLAATLKQLENQKGEAQKRLSDLKAQVDKLRLQAAEQAEAVAQQESELSLKREQLEGLQREESKLEQQKANSSRKLDELTSNLQDTQLHISQVKALITQLQEQNRQMTDAIQLCDSAIELGDANSVAETILRLKPDFRNPEYSKIGLVNGRTSTQGSHQVDEDNLANRLNGSKTPVSYFENDDFNNDVSNHSHNADVTDPFSTAFSKPVDGFSSDPFGENGFNSTKPDPFYAFGDSSFKNEDHVSEPNKDPFGCDPFAILHAPTKESSSQANSPSPALPPKKSKQPPPRPAPPRPAQPPNVKKAPESDLFASGNNDTFASGNTGFADFADFDSKFTKEPNKATAQFKDLDFTDDPFRDYRYEDPFNINFDEEPSKLKTTNISKDMNKISITNGQNMNSSSAEKFDPFGLDGRNSVPLPNSDSLVSVSGRASAPITSELLNEDLQLAWAARESLRLEEDRKKRQLQEQVDFELAISLSQSDAQKS